MLEKWDIKVNYEKLVISILMFVTFFLNVYFVYEGKIIYTTPDEMGPIAIAALWAGQDWSSLMAHCAYYSYGYSILLYPLFVIFKSGTLFYRAAIVLNAVLVAATIPVSYTIGKKIFRGVSPVHLYIGAFISANYVSNIARSPSALCEVLLMFLNWLLLLVFVKLSEKLEIKLCLLSAVLVVYTYAVHQRMLGVLIAYTFSFAVLCWYKRAHIKYYISFLSSLSILLIGHRIVKKMVKAALWYDSPRANTNDYAGVISSITRRMDDFVSFIKNFIYTLSGHLFYIAVATMGLAVIALAYIFINDLKILKACRTRHDLCPEYAVSLYIFMAFLGTLLISVLSMSGSVGAGAERSDTILYGRYIEPILSILIFLGALFVLNCKNRKWIMLLSAGYICFSLLSYRRYHALASLFFNYMTCVGIHIFYRQGSVMYALPTCIVIVLLSVLLLKKGNKLKIPVLMSISIYWIVTGMIFMYNKIVPIWRYKYEFTTLIEEKEELNKGAEWYYYGEERALGTSSYIQFLLKDKAKLNYHSNYAVPNETFYGVADNLSFLWDHEELSLVDSAGGAYLFTNEWKRNEEGICLPLSMFGSGKYDNLRNVEDFSSNGYEGYFLYGPYIMLEEGNYNVALYYTADGVGGYMEVFSNNANMVYDTVDLSDTDNETEKAVLHFSLDQQSEALEFRVYTRPTQNIRIEKIILSKEK